MPKQRVRELMLAAGEGEDRVLHLCASAVGALAVDGVGLSMTNGPGEHSKIAATDDVSDRIEDLQVLLGQGPCVDAVSTGEPVLVEDLAGPDVGGAGRSSRRPRRRWASGRPSRCR